MSASLQPIMSVCGVPQIWIARSGPDHARYGDPYTVACVVIRIDATTARIEALTSALGSAARALLALRGALYRAGFREVIWQRLRNVRVTLQEAA